MRVQRTRTKQLRAPLTTTLGHPKSMQCNFNSCSFNYKSYYSKAAISLTFDLLHCKAMAALFCCIPCCSLYLRTLSVTHGCLMAITLMSHGYHMGVSWLSHWCLMAITSGHLMAITWLLHSHTGVCHYVRNTSCILVANNNILQICVLTFIILSHNSMNYHWKA